jgi:hypothetical protein
LASLTLNYHSYDLCPVSVLVEFYGVALTVHVLFESITIVWYSNIIFYTDFPSSASIVGSSGSTLLHFAAANSRTNILRTLLLCAPRTDRANNHRVIPEMPARETEKDWTAEVLKEAGE